MKEGFVIVLSTAVREFLLGLPRQERKLLKEAMESQLSPQHDRVVPAVDGTALTLEVLGYLITYRSLTGAERGIYKAKDGRFVTDIRAWMEDSPGVT
jgi:hypothetical protein